MAVMAGYRRARGSLYLMKRINDTYKRDMRRGHFTYQQDMNTLRRGRMV